MLHLSCRYHQHVNGSARPRWLLCQASTVKEPVSGEQMTMLVQLDVTDTKHVRCRRSSISGSAAAASMQQAAATPGNAAAAALQACFQCSSSGTLPLQGLKCNHTQSHNHLQLLL
jgi:hypothetical protein